MFTKENNVAAPFSKHGQGKEIGESSLYCTRKED